LNHAGHGVAFPSRTGIAGGFMNFNKKMAITKYGLPSLKDFLQMLMTFMLVTFGLILFMSNDIGQARLYFGRMFSKSIISIPFFFLLDNVFVLLTMVFIVFLLILEWRGRNMEYGIAFTKATPRFRRYFMYAFLVALIYFFGGDARDFIYMQF
jgi:hypothetical protein